MALTSDFESGILAQFDKLVMAREIFYEDPQPELVEHHGFLFQIISFLDKKPISAPDGPGRSKAGGPFEIPRPEEIITSIGPSRRLLVNKYSTRRSMLVLPTKKCAPQTDDLKKSDFIAALTVLHSFSTPQMVIYNCGANAGSSIGHKHLQIFLQPCSERFVLFPAQATSTVVIESNITNVPFKHFVLRISVGAAADAVFERYHVLLKETRKALAEANAGRVYNIIFKTDWIALIPRRTAVWGGLFGANAAGMLGMVAVPTQKQREQLAELGYTEYLTRFGIPRD